MAFRALVILSGIALMLALIVLASFYIQPAPESNNVPEWHPAPDLSDGENALSISNITISERNSINTTQESTSNNTNSEGPSADTNIPPANNAGQPDDTNPHHSGDSSETNEHANAPAENPDRDSDQDGIKDTDEITRGTNPYESDSDGDGIEDKKEIKLGTNPLSSDSDEDGLSDSYEIRKKTNPNDNDTDNDGLIDSQELNLGTNTLKRDSDGDGIDDRQEIKKGTDPLNDNTDGDRYNDKQDPNPALVNSPKVSVRMTISGISQNLELLQESSVNANSTILIVKVKVIADNTGTDYTSFVKFDSIISIDGFDVLKMRSSLGKVDAGKAIKNDQTYTVSLDDITTEVRESIIKDVEMGKVPEISIRVAGIGYEKFK